MSNGHGNPGIRSAWESGDLVFYAGTTELLRLGADGVVSISGLAYPTADGTATQQLTTDGSGTLSFGAA